MTGDAIGRIARRVALQDAIKACEEIQEKSGYELYRSYSRGVYHCVKALEALMDKSNEA